MTVTEVKTYLIECDRASHRKCLSPRVSDLADWDGVSWVPEMTFTIKGSKGIPRRTLEKLGWIVDADLTSMVCPRCR